MRGRAKSKALLLSAVGKSLSFHVENGGGVIADGPLHGFSVKNEASM